MAPNYTNHEVLCLVWPEKWQHRLPTVNYCNAVTWHFIEILAILHFAPFAIALILNTILYALIIFRLNQRDISDDGNETKGLKSQADKVRNAVARMLVINGIVFFLCLAPWQLCILCGSQLW